ncbi:MAG: prepilin peptidase [Candidatus Sungbacteria bacterium]|nr:prepilin peptidase [Candidatus Sungbacteria bacterium]
MASTIFLYSAVFLLGASLGSFVNAAAIRLAAGESFFIPRSRCPRCRKTLSWFELIPIVSYLVLGGLCRSCKGAIAFRYFAAEVALGSWALVLVNIAGSGSYYHPFAVLTEKLGSWETLLIFLFYLLLGSALAVVFLIDYDTQEILTAIVRPLILLGVFLVTAEIWISGAGFGSAAAKTLLLALAIAAAFGVIWAITRGRGLGWGDVELVLALALFLGFPRAVIMVLFAFWIGALWGLGLMAIRGYELKSRVPFGPFLITGFVVAVFWGEILVAYLLPLV